jgi:S1-C subfamily serine protease
MKRTQSPSVSGGLVLGVLVFAAVAFAAGRLFVPQVAPPADPAPRPVAPRPAFDDSEREAVELFKQARGSVVNVDTVLVVRGLDMKLEQQQAGTGSGFVWDDAGHIVTNFHVVQDAVRNRFGLRVVLADRTALNAKVVGLAPEFDLAVLKIDTQAEKLRAIPIGSSKDLEVGQRCYAIGNPFGLSLTLTKGIVSALDRAIDSPAGTTIPGAIQTDAPINPGNSGGPLLDRAGRLIGVNTAIKTTSGGSVGIGFAVPADTVNAVVPVLIRDGKILKPDLGVELLDLRTVRRSGFDRGVMIREATPGGPAEKAGLVGVRINRTTGEVLAGDIILAVSGVEIMANPELGKLLFAKHTIGETVKLTIRRGDRELEVEVKLAGR